MKIYVKIDKDNIIRDCITYPYGDYIEVDVVEIPLGVYGGWFKLENGIIVECPELKPKSDADEILELKQQIEQQNSAIADLTMLISTMQTPMA